MINIVRIVVILNTLGWLWWATPQDVFASLETENQTVFNMVFVEEMGDQVMFSADGTISWTGPNIKNRKDAAVLLRSAGGENLYILAIAKLLEEPRCAEGK